MFKEFDQIAAMMTTLQGNLRVVAEISRQIRTCFSEYLWKKKEQGVRPEVEAGQGSISFAQPAARQPCAAGHVRRPEADLLHAEVRPTRFPEICG